MIQASVVPCPSCIARGVWVTAQLFQGASVPLHLPRGIPTQKDSLLGRFPRGRTHRPQADATRPPRQTAEAALTARPCFGGNVRRRELAVSATQSGSLSTWSCILGFVSRASDAASAQFEIFWFVTEDLYQCVGVALICLIDLFH